MTLLLRIAARQGLYGMMVQSYGPQIRGGEAAVLDRRGRNVTEDVIEGCRAALNALERASAIAFIAKESSPTCGLAKARVGSRRRETVLAAGPRELDTA
jgi:uncharacterized protein YbbK (DUF523 family)